MISQKAGVDPIKTQSKICDNLTLQSCSKNLFNHVWKRLLNITSKSGKVPKWISAGLISLAVCAELGADEADMTEYASLFPLGRHLVEFSYSKIDTTEGDQLLWLPQYTYAYSTSLRFSGSIGYSELNATGASARSGATNSELLVQYDPSAQLTANAFIPDTLGFTFGLQIPTADHDKGLGTDFWAASLGFGWLIDFPLDFWLLPYTQYQFSFNEGPGQEEIKRVDLGLGLYWLFPFKGWLGIEPVIAYDANEKDNALDWSVVIGKVWSTGWGVDLRWSKLDRLDEEAIRDDELIFFGLSYQFGSPPRNLGVD